MHQNRYNNDYGQLTAAQLRARIADIEREGNKREVARLRVELARRWAAPLAVIFFAVLAVAAAGGGRRGGAPGCPVTPGGSAAASALSPARAALVGRGRD